MNPRILFAALTIFTCLQANAGPIIVNWEANGGVDSVYAGGASISFSPIYVQSLDAISISGYWTNLVDTRYSSLQAEIRIHENGTWQTVAFDDHVRGGYGSISTFVSSDFQILPNVLSSGSVDGIMIAPNSVIYSGLGGLNGGSGTSFSFTSIPISEPSTLGLALTSLILFAAVFRMRNRTTGLQLIDPENLTSGNFGRIVGPACVGS